MPNFRTPTPGLMNSTNAFNGQNITMTTSTLTAGLGVAITKRYDAPSLAIFQRLTDELDRETNSVFIDELDYFRRDKVRQP
ncbi:hypothetical protein [uncultured Corynebacterium sp.]|uniref:hypothetical protein n=1 Tax=uncultured Corynebacterium sp. TaxID=159447 RepID=UPI0025991D03|nr:hypothetical protein [uncultured Corynebacterium sp.]